MQHPSYLWSTYRLLRQAHNCRRLLQGLRDNHSRGRGELVHRVAVSDRSSIPEILVSCRHVAHQENFEIILGRVPGREDPPASSSIWMEASMMPSHSY